MLQLVGELLALLLAEFFALAKLQFLFAQTLQHRLLCQVPLILFLILCLARNVLGAERCLVLLSCQLLCAGLINSLLHLIGFLAEGVDLLANISELGARLVESNRKLVEYFLSHFF